jgi:uncharacterized membrane protein HdeD (DUF308 family)
VVAVVAEVYEEEVTPPPKWQLIVGGILWLLVALVMLSLDSTGAATLGYLVGFVLLLAGIDEFVLMSLLPGWRWAHAILGVLLIIGGIAALLEPFQTFGILALLIGWYLLIKGFMDIALAIALHRTLPLWGLTLGAGIIEALLGLWALGYPGRSAWLLMVWVGIAALMRGINDLVAAFWGGAR